MLWHVQRLAVLALVALIVVPGTAAGAETAARATTAAPATTAAADAYDSSDIGFAEGAQPHAGGLERRLDGIASYVPGEAPFIRVDLNWWYVEPCKGCALQWDRLDAVVDGAAARGMRVLLILGYAPPWANGGHTNDTWFPTNDADWASIVDRTVQHFGDKVQVYEVWNEPNNEWFGKYDGDRRARYWQLVRLAHQRIKQSCADCVVLAGASGGGTPSSDGNNEYESAAWLDWAYANGYGRYFDAVAHHPYPAWNSGKGPAEPECRNRWWNMFGPPGETPPCGELAYVHSIMAKHGDTSKKIWATEWGYPTSGSPRPVPLETVRDFMVEGVAMWRALPYAGPLFLYSYRDACGDAGDPECNFGVVREDFTPKEPLFTDLAATLTDTWRPSLLTEQRMRRRSSLLSRDGRFQLWLQEDGNLVLYRRDGGASLWATGTSDGVTLINQDDGNLVLYRADGRPVWSSGTYGNGPSTLWMQEDGNLVLYRDRDGKPTWSSGTFQR
jgi:polysaccharide biosynthesis protein PslG